MNVATRRIRCVQKERNPHTKRLTLYSDYYLQWTIYIVDSFIMYCVIGALYYSIQHPLDYSSRFTKSFCEGGACDDLTFYCIAPSYIVYDLAWPGIIMLICIDHNRDVRLVNHYANLYRPQSWCAIGQFCDRMGWFINRGARSRQIRSGLLINMAIAEFSGTIADINW